MNLEIGKDYNVTAVKLLPAGVLVELEDKTTQLVHISNVADCYVTDVADFVSVGKQYSARCEVGNTRPVQLTFKHLGLTSQRTPLRQKPKRATKCLDTMINAANSSFEEKNRRYNKRNRRGK